MPAHVTKLSGDGEIDDFKANCAVLASVYMGISLSIARTWLLPLRRSLGGVIAREIESAIGGVLC